MFISAGGSIYNRGESELDTRQSTVVQRAIVFILCSCVPGCVQRRPWRPRSELRPGLRSQSERDHRCDRRQYPDLLLNFQPQDPHFLDILEESSLKGNVCYHFYEHFHFSRTHGEKVFQNGFSLNPAMINC